MATQEIVNVRVSRRVLWIGSDAYPLQNIARAQTRELTLKNGSPVRNYFKAVVRWVILGVVVTIALKLAKVGSSGVFDLVWVVVLALLAISTIRLIAMLRKNRTYYALIIETAGTPNTALVSPDLNLVNQLVGQIMEAIDNPQAEFQVQVENFHVGDKIHQVGDYNVGKMTR